MKFLKKFFFIIAILAALIVTFRYILKEKIFPYKYEQYVNTYSEMYNLDPLFVLAVIKTESNFDESAQSHKNAVGLMQITEDTGEWIAKQMNIYGFSSDNLYDEEINIKMGCWYLRYLLDMYNGNSDLAIAAYNAGPNNVNSWLSNEEYSKNGETLQYIPFGETKKYVDRINVYYEAYIYLYTHNKEKSHIIHVIMNGIDLIKNQMKE